MPKLPHPLGRNKSTFDPRDYNLRNFIPRGAQLKLAKESNWEFPHEALNQGETPHCVGFSMAGFGINEPVHYDFTDTDGHKFYYECKKLEGEPEAENGSTIRTAAKVLQKSGRIGTYAFAPDMQLVKYWLLNKGPLIVGTIWNMNMFEPKPDGTLDIGGELAGGHAYLINEWRLDNYIGIQNSWGPSWGKNGKAYISAADFEKLFKYDGEALAAVELDTHTISKPPCPLIDFFTKLFK